MPMTFSYEGKRPYKPTAMRATTEKRVGEWRDKIVHGKLDPWRFMGTGPDVVVHVTQHSGKVIHYGGGTFQGAAQLVFWSDDLMPPFLDDAIEGVLRETAEACREHGLPPDDCLDEAVGFLRGLVDTVYDEMASIDAKLMKYADHRAHPRRDVSEYVNRMLPRIEGHAKAARLLAGQDKTLNAQGQAVRKPNGQAQASANGGAHVNVTIQNSTVTMGDIGQTQNLTIGDRNSVGKQTPTSLKNKKNIKKTITACVLFLAALLTVLQIFFGWMGGIWRFLTSK